jgi:hypothetical protein
MYSELIISVLRGLLQYLINKQEYPIKKIGYNGMKTQYNILFMIALIIKTNYCMYIL